MQVLVDLPSGQDLASRWGVTASSFVFNIISLFPDGWALVTFGHFWSTQG